VLAGVIIDQLSYHWLFWLPLTGVVGAAIASAVFIPESPVNAPARIPRQAVALLSSGLAALLLAISRPRLGLGIVDDDRAARRRTRAARSLGACRAARQDAAGRHARDGATRRRDDQPRRLPARNRDASRGRCR
jgi:hypothetical protein